MSLLSQVCPTMWAQLPACPSTCKIHTGEGSLQQSYTDKDENKPGCFKALQGPAVPLFGAGQSEQEPREAAPQEGHGGELPALSLMLISFCNYYNYS